MAELVFTDILDGISLKLHTAYPTAHIFAGSVPQGVAPGDFNIINVTASQEKRLGKQYARSAAFDIVYYGDSANADTYLPIADAVMLLLADIVTPDGDILHAGNMASRIDTEEKVLHITLDFAARVYVSEALTPMASLKIEQEG